MSLTSTDPDPERGQRIRAARERRGWSQQDLADALGVTYKSVGNWERGGVIRSHAGALEQALGISLRETSARLADATAEQLATELVDRIRDLERRLADSGADGGTDDG